MIGYRLTRDPDRETGWTLWVDGTPQSHVDTAAPTHLEFEYVRWIAFLVDALAEPGRPLIAIHLGGGALTLPRYVAATRPRSRQRVVEIDAELTSLVRRRLPLPARSGVRVRDGDAREALAAMPPGRADVVISDVFVNGRVPARFASAEFASAAATVLSPTGCLVCNVADGPGLRFGRSVAATLLACFATVALIGEASVLRGRRFGNLVLAGSNVDLPVEAVRRRCAADPVPTRVVDGQDLRRLVAGAQVLTDASAEGSPSPPDSLV